MSKIICDVCGTSYPETATQCPICGCVRPGDARTVSSDTKEPQSRSGGTYTYVKGGRFSKANVKKRNRAGQAAPSHTVVNPEKKEHKEGKKDKGLAIAVIVLLLAIVAVVVYIAFHFFVPSLSNVDGNTTASTADTTASSIPTILEIPCSELVISKSSVEFDSVGAALLLNVTTDPLNTTDAVVFSSSDEAVASVSVDGKIVAVGAGQATITVSCGDAVAECTVVCNIVEETTQSTEDATYPTDDFKLNRSDFTLSRKGEIHVLYNGDIPADVITWSSDDESVATVENGKVVAVGTGMTTVYAEYGDVKLSCIVRCSDAVGKAEASSEGIPGSDDISEVGAA